MVGGAASKVRAVGDWAPPWGVSEIGSLGEGVETGTCRLGNALPTLWNCGRSLLSLPTTA